MNHASRADKLISIRSYTATATREQTDIGSLSKETFSSYPTNLLVRRGWTCVSLKTLRARQTWQPKSQPAAVAMLNSAIRRILQVIVALLYALVHLT